MLRDITKPDICNRVENRLIAYGLPEELERFQQARSETWLHRADNQIDLHFETSGYVPIEAICQLSDEWPQLCFCLEWQAEWDLFENIHLFTFEDGRVSDREVLGEEDGNYVWQENHLIVLPPWNELRDLIHGEREFIRCVPALTL